MADHKVQLTFIDDGVVKMPKKDRCPGKIYRFTKSVWIGSDGDVNFQERFRPIHGLSCAGCERCEYLHDDLQEFVANYKWGVEGIEYDGAEGKLYKLEVTNISTDWETGKVDDYDLEFVEVKE